jgi:hypothetical protein
MIGSLSELRPPAREIAEHYLETVAAATPAALREEVRADLSAHLCEHLDPTSTPADVERVVAASGPADAGPEPWARRALRDLRAGFSPIGVAARIARTWWNPADERLLVPRALGWGWDLNFGAAAVRLGLIEPDAEAVPFTATPESALRLAAAVPVALAGATVLHYAVRGRTLPRRLPAHWTVSGRPDRWTSRRRAAAIDLATAAAGAGLAAWAVGSARPAPERVGLLAGATMAAGIGAGTTVARSLGERPRPFLAPALALSGVIGVGTVLVGLARAARSAEIARDLPRKSQRPPAGPATARVTEPRPGRTAHPTSSSRRAPGPTP